MSGCHFSPPSDPIPGELACFGFNTSGTNLSSFWALNDCPTVLATVLNTRTDGTIGYNNTKLARAQNDVQELFCQFLSTNTLTDNTDSPQHNPFQNTLVNFCNDPRLPGVCDKALSNQACANVTRAQATTGRIYADLCGCYVPPDNNYLPSTNNAACDPLCHRVSTVQRAEASTGELLTCSNNVCVIDNVSISVNNSDLSGVNFEQVCGGCNEPNHPCTCIISGVDLTTTMSQSGLGSQFTQLCGPNSLCLLVNDDNTVTQVPCAQYNPNDQQVTVTSKSNNVYYFLAVIAVIMIVILLAFLAMRYG